MFNQKAYHHFWIRTFLQQFEYVDIYSSFTVQMNLTLRKIVILIYYFYFHNKIYLFWISNKNVRNEYFLLSVSSAYTISNILFSLILLPFTHHSSEMKMHEVCSRFFSLFFFFTLIQHKDKRKCFVAGSVAESDFKIMCLDLEWAWNKKIA